MKDMYTHPSKPVLVMRIALMLGIGVLGALGAIVAAAFSNPLVLLVGVGLTATGVFGPFAEVRRFRQ
ncbi:hypothetical protein [Nocardia terpenica]|uniref:Uncharacterized protein n=1 Tax=Nocardia terpenica TaxID=455432 RepID=A0A161WEX9_9NOCA|nr:hypothetical protein [Nocardia terpenica]KZM75469.1 hypothetical protein AWN90_18995 [Nocardia terpenica]NQE85937.1 hypothetical protein [Nocardia terpenica]